MIKFVIVVMIVTLFLGCAKRESRAVTDAYILPEELRDCLVFQLESDLPSARDVTVLRCPNSSTATTTTERTGKSTRTIRTVVVDGVTYVEEGQDVKN